jgi:hypothetical protein
VFRSTNLDDKTHVEFSRRLGELDDIKRYMVGGRKPRYAYYELFDAGNVDNEGHVLDPDSPRAQFGKVSIKLDLTSIHMRKHVAPYRCVCHLEVKPGVTCHCIGICNGFK